MHTSWRENGGRARCGAAAGGGERRDLDVAVTRRATASPPWPHPTACMPHFLALDNRLLIMVGFLAVETAHHVH